MAKRTISFKDYEEPTWEEYTGEDPPIGKWFPGKAVRAKYLEEDDQVQIIFEITEGDYAGWGRGLYLPLDPSDSVYWKTQQTIKALQGGVAKDVAVDFENQKSLDLWLSKMKPVKMKIGEYKERVRVDKVAPLLEAVPAKKATGSKAAPAPEPEPEDDEPIEDYTAEELGEMEASELEEILTEEFELAKDDEDFPKKSRRDRDGSKYKADLIEAILAEQESDEDEDEDDGEDGDFEDGFEEDPEPEPEPEPEKPARRSRATKADPVKAAPAKATASTRRRRS